MGNFKTKGKRRAVNFRISELAEQRLGLHAELFNMTPTEYAKAVLYKDLGLFTEPLDKRRRSWKRKQRQDPEEQELL